MDTIRGHIKRIPELLAPKIDAIKTNFDQWKVPWTQDRAEKVDNLDATVSSRASKVDMESANTTIQGVQGDLLALTSRGVVKSVQRGVVKVPGTTNASRIRVQIGPIDINKASAIALPSAIEETGGTQIRDTSSEAYLLGLGANYIDLSGQRGRYVYWQVIEFY